MEATGQKTLAEAWQERQDDLNTKTANGKPQYTSPFIIRK